MAILYGSLPVTVSVVKKVDEPREMQEVSASTGVTRNGAILSLVLLDPWRWRHYATLQQCVPFS